MGIKSPFPDWGPLPAQCPFGSVVSFLNHVGLVPRCGSKGCRMALLFLTPALRPADLGPRNWLLLELHPPPGMFCSLLRTRTFKAWDGKQMLSRSYEKLPVTPSLFPKSLLKRRNVNIVLRPFQTAKGLVFHSSDWHWGEGPRWAQIRHSESDLKIGRIYFLVAFELKDGLEKPQTQWLIYLLIQLNKCCAWEVNRFPCISDFYIFLIFIF